MSALLAANVMLEGIAAFTQGRNENFPRLHCCADDCGLDTRRRLSARPIRMIVPWAPGGGSEISARIVGQKLGEYSARPS